MGIAVLLNLGELIKMIFTGYLAIILIDTSMYINKIANTLAQYKYTEAHE
tara:strand:+ start:3325 stop:3474 length:150 start_codon:yes stop_codon:yes gene_type:complete